MKSINYTSLIVSIILLYWCTTIGYNRVVKVEQIDIIPLFHKQKSIITHLDFQQQKNPVDDLNIYYSGVKTHDTIPQQLITNQETKIHEEMSKVVKEKQTNQYDTTPIKEQDLIDKKDKKIEKSIVQPKSNKKTKLKTEDDDAFSISKTYKKVDKQPNNKPKINVFDVIE